MVQRLGPMIGATPDEENRDSKGKFAFPLCCLGANSPLRVRAWEIDGLRSRCVRSECWRDVYAAFEVKEEQRFKEETARASCI